MQFDGRKRLRTEPSILQSILASRILASYYNILLSLLPGSVMLPFTLFPFRFMFVIAVGVTGS